MPGDNPSVELAGDHGYDNRVDSMHPIFYAFGPVFRRKLLAEPFRSVDIYPLMSHVLQLKERKTNGSFSNVKNLLRPPNWFDAIILNWGVLSNLICSNFSSNCSIDFASVDLCYFGDIHGGGLYSCRLSTFSTTGLCRTTHSLPFIEQ